MDYAKRAADVNLEGYQCKVCDSEVGAEQPIAYDIDGGHGDDGSQVRARVACWTCYEALKQREMETWIQAANLARAHGYAVMADDCMVRARGISTAMEQATKAA